MARRNRKNQHKDAAPEKDMQFNPFADLQANAFPEAQKKEKPDRAEIKVNFSPYEAILNCPLHLRLEKKGRGGKTVTVIEGLPLDHDEEVFALAKDLRKQLSTGGSLAEDCIELQGDQRNRAGSWLKEKGFTVKGQIG